MLRLLLRVLPLVVLAWVVVSVFLFVFPRQDRPRHAAAIVVLGGDARGRLPLALKLIRQRIAPVLVISDGADSFWPPAQELCAHPGGRSFKVLCFTPTPFSTRGEAEDMKKIAARHGWNSLLVVTSTYHIYRARLLFGRCFDRRTHLYFEGERSGWLSLPLNAALETVKLIRAETLQRGC